MLTALCEGLWIVYSARYSAAHDDADQVSKVAIHVFNTESVWLFLSSSLRGVSELDLLRG